MIVSVGHPATGRPVGPVLRAQLAVTALVAVVCGLALRNWAAAVSALAGGGIGVVATAYMAFSLFRPGADASSGRVLRGFVVGWIVKVALTITLLIIAFRSKFIAPLPLLVGYATTYLAYWWWGIGPGRRGRR
jgi:F0F1-type ATP synthase assembly protein I